MRNPSWKNDERNHHNTFSANNSTSPQSSVMKHNVGIAVFWNPEEQAILDDGLVRYASLPTIQRYAKIASQLHEKTIRDVAMRCRFLYKNKRRKEDHNGFGKARFNNKGITSNLSEEDVLTNELLDQNKQLLNQISANLTSLRIEENLTLLARSRENIRKLLILNENVPEAMKHMPPLPEKLNDELADSICMISQIYQSYHQ